MPKDQREEEDELQEILFDPDSPELASTPPHKRGSGIVVQEDYDE